MHRKTLVTVAATSVVVGYVACKLRKGDFRYVNTTRVFSNVFSLSVTGFTVWMLLGDSRRRVIGTRIREAVTATRTEITRLNEPAWMVELRNHVTRVDDHV